MNASRNPAASPLIRKLERLTDLSDDEKQALTMLPLTVRALEADQDIVRDKDRPSQCCLLLEGFACRYKLLDDGRRQILSFHIPGDIPDLRSLHLPVMDHSIGTLVPCQVAFIPHQSLHDLLLHHPRLAQAFWRDTLIDAAIFCEWMVGLGRRRAQVRVAHLLCELLVRLRAVGLTDDHAYKLPVTQAEIADALGLTGVHVNRNLQELRGKRLITLRGRALSVQDWEGLQRVGEFDPTYLYPWDKAVA